MLSKPFPSHGSLQQTSQVGWSSKIGSSWIPLFAGTPRATNVFILVELPVTSASPSSRSQRHGDVANAQELLLPLDPGPRERERPGRRRGGIAFFGWGAGSLQHGQHGSQSLSNIGGKLPLKQSCAVSFPLSLSLPLSLTWDRVPNMSLGVPPT